MVCSHDVGVAEAAADCCLADCPVIRGSTRAARGACTTEHHRLHSHPQTAPMALVDRAPRAFAQNVGEGHPVRDVCVQCARGCLDGQLHIISDMCAHRSSLRPKVRPQPSNPGGHIGSASCLVRSQVCGQWCSGLCCIEVGFVAGVAAAVCGGAGSGAPCTLATAGHVHSSSHCRKEHRDADAQAHTQANGPCAVITTPAHISAWNAPLPWAARSQPVPVRQGGAGR
mmetsp:Transcript_17524/g.44139  ORF Transcript_17524/g.44139 Transcript_17524/m.44139 type:complete len:227 (+) Transcript_17524:295-975(+)